MQNLIYLGVGETTKLICQLLFTWSSNGSSAIGVSLIGNRSQSAIVPTPPDTSTRLNSSSSKFSSSTEPTKMSPPPSSAGSSKISSSAIYSRSLHRNPSRSNQLQNFESRVTDSSKFPKIGSFGLMFSVFSSCISLLFCFAFRRKEPIRRGTWQTMMAWWLKIKIAASSPPITLNPNHNFNLTNCSIEIRMTFKTAV